VTAKKSTTAKKKSSTPKPTGTDTTKPAAKPEAKAAKSTKAPAAKKVAAKAKAPAKGPAKAATKSAAKSPAPKAPAMKAAATKAAAPKGKTAKKAPPAKATTPEKVKTSPVKKSVAKKPAKQAKAPAKPLSNKEKLKKLLAMRAADTKTKSREAAEGLRKGSGSTVPSSVHKAAEFAETRKISSIVKSGKRSAKDEPPAPPPKKARKRKAPYSKSELRELKEILESERTRLLRDLAVMNEVATSSEENMSRSFSNHQADAATDTSALETTFVTRRYEEERLSQVTRALERLESGSYGLCEMCTEEPLKRCESCPFIPIGRLRAKPFAILCLPCRQELEKKNRR